MLSFAMSCHAVVYLDEFCFDTRLANHTVLYTTINPTSLEPKTRVPALTDHQ